MGSRAVPRATGRLFDRVRGPDAQAPAPHQSNGHRSLVLHGLERGALAGDTKIPGRSGHSCLATHAAHGRENTAPSLVPVAHQTRRRVAGTVARRLAGGLSPTETAN